MSIKENNGEIKSRMQRREQKKMWKPSLFVNDKLKTNPEKSGEKEKIRIRLIPIWLRLIIISVLFVFCILIGAVIGYSIIGDGKFIDSFKPSTWTKIIDLVEKK